MRTFSPILGRYTGLLLGLLFLLPLVAGAAQAGEFLLVKDLPFVGKTTNIATYLKNLFRLGLGLAVTLAILMLVVNGIKFMVSDIFGERKKASDGMWGAIIGLLIIFGAVLILNTINPRLTEFNIVDSINRTVAAIKRGQAAQPRPLPPAGCPNCVPVPDGVRCKDANSCMIDPSLVPKLRELANNLRNLGWWITEAYPATVRHDSICHGNGTCFDANITGARTLANINAFLQGAQSAGFGVIYEVQLESTRNALIQAGVPAASIFVNPGINAPHFHVTNG